MELDVLGLLSACSYALDCVEAELVHVTDRHAKRVAYMSVCTAEQMGILGKELQDLSFSQIKALADFFARIVDYKSPFTSTHSIGIAVDAEMLARHMGFDEETAQKMYLAGALHDIGKVAIGNEILEKPERLTEDEFKTMKHHAAYTYYILSGVDNFEEIRDWAAFHHERLDGSGYPFGKSAADLNTQERMMACIDIYQALTESRPYKQGMPHEKAYGILRDMAGKGWIDAGIVEAIDACFGA